MAGVRYYSPLQTVQAVSVTHPTSQSVCIRGNTTGASSLPPISADIRNAWNYTSTSTIPSWCAQGWQYVYERKHQLPYSTLWADGVLSELIIFLM